MFAVSETYGDGVTQARDHIQSVLDTAEAAGGGTVYIPAGVYLITPYTGGPSSDDEGKGLDVPANVTLAGAGDATILKVAPRDLTTASFVRTVFVRGDAVTPIENVHLRDFCVDGNKANITGTFEESKGEGVNLKYANRCSVQNVLVINTSADGIDLDNATESLVMGCRMIGTAGSGIHVSSGSTENRIIGNNAYGCGLDLDRSGIDEVVGVSGNVYIGNAAKDCHQNFGLQQLSESVGNLSLGTPVQTDTLGTLKGSGSATAVALLASDRDVTGSSVALAIKTIVDGVFDDRLRFRGTYIEMLQNIVASGTLSTEGTITNKGGTQILGAAATAAVIRALRDVTGSQAGLTVQTTIAGALAARMTFRADYIDVAQAMRHSGNVGFNGTAPLAKPTVTGSRADGTALASLLTALASYGLITDSSTA